MSTLILRATGQVVASCNAAIPAGLRRTKQGYTTIIIPPTKAGARCSVQQVRNSKLTRVQGAQSNG